MKSQRAWMMTLSTIVALMAAASTANGQFPSLHPVPGFHPAAHPSATMVDQQSYDPTWIGNANYGDTCCGPNWYDFSIDAVYMKRDNAGRNVPLSSDGIAGVEPPNVVLSTADLDFDYEPGLQASARYQLSAVYNIEAGYLGVVDWGAHASVTSENDSLYSFFSQFGNQPFGGFADVDQASFHSVNYRTHLDTVELNMRRSWILPSYRLHGSWLTGFRWLKLRDEMDFFAQVAPHFDPINEVDRDAAFTDYRLQIDNNLYGSQLGGQLGVCILPGLLVTGDIKAGAYYLQSTLDSQLTSTSLPTARLDFGDSDDIALLAQAGAYVTYQLHPLWKIRAGYQFLYLDGIALAPSNISRQQPFTGGTRLVAINDNGDALFHGGVLGLEIGW